jgi:hypothetical protein
MVAEVVMASRLVRVNPVTVNDMLAGHVLLDLDCLDRVYLHGYLPPLQVGGQVVQFLRHRGYPVPSPACLHQIGDAFRRSVGSFAEANHIPMVRLKSTDRNIEVMRPYLDAAARTGRSQVAAIGVAQEPQRVFIARQRDTDPSKAPQFSFDKLDRRVTVYYFYLWDTEFGPAFIKICTYCPWPIKVWVNGHEWAKRQAIHTGLGFTELSNGFAATDDPAALQQICDRLGSGTLTVFFQRWLARLPLPLTGADRDAGYWWELSMAQVEVSRTIVFTQPRYARGFFEALVGDNLPRTAARYASRPSSTPRTTWAVSVVCATSKCCRPRHVRSTPGCCRLNVSVRAATSRIQSSSGSRTRRSPPTGAELQPCASATLGCKPWPALYASPCAPSPASPTGVFVP